MRHRKHHTKLNRKTGHRDALLRNLAKALILSKDGEGKFLDRIETTDTKAKALRSFIEPLVTLGKKGQVHHRRLAFARLQDKVAVHRLFEEIAPRYTERNGGYTRLIRTRRRMGDGAEMAYVEFVDRAEAEVTAAETPAASTNE